MRIGEYDISTLETGRFRLDGGAMFGVVPKPLWSRRQASDESNRITLAMRCLLLESSDRTIVVDTGAGEKFASKERSIFGLDYSETDLISSLRAEGLEPADVTDVILTHLHFDHAGGATRYRDPSEGDPQTVVPTFPNATYYLQWSHLQWAKDPSELDQASFYPENWEPLEESGQLRTLDGPEDVFPGIDFRIVKGHTPHQQLVEVDDGENRLCYCADLLPTSSHLDLPYIMGYDLEPLITLREKKEFLPTAVDRDWILVFEHDPDIAAARIGKDGKRYRVVEEIDL